MISIARHSHNIREALLEDLPHLAQLEAETVQFPWTLGHYQSAFTAGNGIWLLTHQGAVLGVAILRAVADEAELLNCFIVRSWQGRGLAKYFLSRLLSRLARLGITRCCLEVRLSNVVAQSLYLRLGFEQVGVRRGYYPAFSAGGQSGREDAVVMSCEQLKIKQFDT